MAVHITVSNTARGGKIKGEAIIIMTGRKNVRPLTDLIEKRRHQCRVTRRGEGQHRTQGPLRHQRKKKRKRGSFSHLTGGNGEREGRQRPRTDEAPAPCPIPMRI